MTTNTPALATDPPVPPPPAQPDPTSCDRCRLPLRGGYVERWRGDSPATATRVEVLCYPCKDDEEIKNYTRTSVLTTSLVTQAAIERARFERHGRALTPPTNHKVWLEDMPDMLIGPRQITLLQVALEVAAVEEAIKAFEAVVWFKGLQAKVLAAKFRGFRADFTMPDGGATCAMAWSCAGRTMITIEPADGTSQVSVVVADDAATPTMGLQGIRATKYEALALLRRAIVELSGEGAAKFVRDDQVGML